MVWSGLKIYHPPRHQVGAILMADIAHISGLVATGDVFGVFDGGCSFKP